MSERQEKEDARQGGRGSTLLDDVAITAEFEYEEEWESVGESGVLSASGLELDVEDTHGAGRGVSEAEYEIERALDEFDSRIDLHEKLDSLHPGSDVLEFEQFPSQALATRRDEPSGFGEAQLSGVFSGYEEPDGGGVEGFDLFNTSDAYPAQADKTLGEISAEHAKQIKQLEYKVAYQKQVLQVMGDMLVEARVISRKGLKERLRALRRRHSSSF